MEAAEQELYAANMKNRQAALDAALTLQTTPATPKSEFLLGLPKTFLWHLGFATGTEGQPVQVLNDKSQDLKLLLEHLDSEGNLRKSLKIGLVYVNRGQYDQQAILCNSRGSPLYDRFLNLLGKPKMTFDTTRGVKADPQVVCYETTLYELVFHVATLMPTVRDDPQQIEKKKYIGNDSVHIVWSENDREYKPGTISGAFNFVHIVLDPLRNGLIKVQICKKKDQVKFFGPLLNGMVLPLELLPSLLRHTVINARKSITSKRLQIYNPMIERISTIEKIVAKCAIPPRNKEEEQFLVLNKLMHL
jgi:hypothetical protein